MQHHGVSTAVLFQKGSRGESVPCLPPSCRGLRQAVAILCSLVTPTSASAFTRLSSFVPMSCSDKAHPNSYELDYVSKDPISK